MYCRYDFESQKVTVTVLKAADLDTGFLPDAKHVEFDDLVKGLNSLGELIGRFQELAGFQTDDGGG
jgi:hypothetical protein